MSAPLGSSRDAVRGFRASSSASTSRFSAIATVRAPTIATVIQSMSPSPGQSPAARNAPTYANGSAKTVCSMRTSDARRRGSGAVPCSTRSCLPVGRRAIAGGELEAVPERGPQHREPVAAAAGEPGRLTTSVAPRRPATPRESSAWGVRVSASERIASAMPGASRSITVEVASGVTSRGAKPVPPVVNTSNASLGQLLDRAGDRLRVVGHDAADDVEPVLAQQPLERVAARVLALTRVHAVGHREHRGPHASGSFVFSTSRTSSISMSLSTAFAMS